MAKQPRVKFTANFERNLEEIERFLMEAQTAQAFDSLLDELLATVIPHLEQFPAMGRPFMRHQARSVEATTALAALTARLAELAPNTEALREYVLRSYLLLYVPLGEVIYLLAIRHQQQLSFDFGKH